MGTRSASAPAQITWIDGERGGTYLYVEMIGKDVKTMMEIRDSFVLKKAPK